MGSHASEIDVVHGVTEESETTIEFKIKTLDSQTHALRVNKCVPVPLLKEKIADVTGIISEQQRLICRGKVLKDDELLSAYHVEDGHTLHLVVRQPDQSTSAGITGHEATPSNSARHQGPSVARSIVLEAVNVDQGNSEFSSLGQILSSLFSSLGAPQNLGSHVLGGPTSTDTGSSGPTPSRPFPASVRVELDSQQAPLLFQSDAPLGLSEPNVIPHSLTTISQYLDFMRDEFRRAGFNTNGRAQTNVDHGTTGVSSSGIPNHDSRADSAFGQHGLPSASLLAEALHSTRQLLVEQAGECLSQLSRQLEDHVNVTDVFVRTNHLANAMRSGALLQNLGSLLLELGRTTLMLRMGQTPSEVIVNAAPAVFISASRPNALMVQSVPYFPGSSSGQMGPIFSGLGLQSDQLGSLLRPRDVEVHVHTSRAVPIASTNPSEQVGAQQAQQHTDRTRTLRENISEALSGVMGTAPSTVEPGVRVLPLRTVVAVPAGLNRSPSSSSGSGVGVMYPLLTRIQQVATGNASDARSTQSPVESPLSGIHVNQQPILEPSIQAQINIGATREPGSNPLNGSGHLGSTDSSMENNTQTNGQIPFSQFLGRLQWIGSLISGTSNQESVNGPVGEQADARRNADTPEASEVSDEGILFSNLVRQVMPYISQGSAVDQSGMVGNNNSSSLPTTGERLHSASGGLNESSGSHQHHRDLPESPDPKRRRTSE